MSSTTRAPNLYGIRARMNLLHAVIAELRVELTQRPQVTQTGGIVSLVYDDLTEEEAKALTDQWKASVVLREVDRG